MLEKALKDVKPTTWLSCCATLNMYTIIKLVSSLSREQYGAGKQAVIIFLLPSPGVSTVMISDAI